MKLFLISQSVVGGYDTFDSAVVAAESAEDAVTIHPSSIYGISSSRQDAIDGKFTDRFSWAENTKDVYAVYLGEAFDRRRGVICASFNAG